MIRYPSVLPLEGSPLREGESALPLWRLRGQRVVVEEKLDGWHAGISFDAHGHLLLQGREAFLTGADWERPLAGFKQWAAEHRDVLFETLRTHYVLYGEWLGTARRSFYDAVPGPFVAFDVLDRITGWLLPLEDRIALLRDLPVGMAPVLWDGTLEVSAALPALLGPSRCKTPRWRDALVAEAVEAGIPAVHVIRALDASPLMEGLCVKTEKDGRTRRCYKLVRPDFRADAPVDFTLPNVSAAPQRRFAVAA
jgi:hypothetical protein